MPTVPSFYTIPLPLIPDVSKLSQVGYITLKYSPNPIRVYVSREFPRQVIIRYAGNNRHNEWYIQPNARIMTSIADLVDYAEGHLRVTGEITVVPWILPTDSDLPPSAHREEPIRIHTRATLDDLEWSDFAHEGTIKGQILKMEIEPLR